MARIFMRKPSTPSLYLLSIFSILFPFCSGIGTIFFGRFEECFLIPVTMGQRVEIQYASVGDTSMNLIFKVSLNGAVMEEQAYKSDHKTTITAFQDGDMELCFRKIDHIFKVVYFAFTIMEKEEVPKEEYNYQQLSKDLKNLIVKFERV